MDLATFRDVCRSMIIKITAVIEKKGPMIEKKQDAREDSPCMLVLSRTFSLQLYEAKTARCGGASRKIHAHQDAVLE